MSDEAGVGRAHGGGRVGPRSDGVFANTTQDAIDDALADLGHEKGSGDAPDELHAEISVEVTLRPVDDEGGEDAGE